MRSEAWHGIGSRRSRQARCHPSWSTTGPSGSARSTSLHAGENKQTLTHLRSSCHRWISGNLRCTSIRRSLGCSRRSGHTGGPGSASTRLHLQGQIKKKVTGKMSRGRSTCPPTHKSNIITFVICSILVRKLLLF